MDVLAEPAAQCRTIADSDYDDPDRREVAQCAGAWEPVRKIREPTDIIRAIRRVAVRQSKSKSTGE